jgi:hypothetical protein
VTSKPTPTGTLRPLGRFSVKPSETPDPFPAEEAATPVVNSRGGLLHRILRICSMLPVEDLRLIYSFALRLCTTKDGGR